MNDTTKLTMRLAAIAGLALSATSAHAAVTYDSTNPELGFTVASGDLLESATIAAQSGWSTTFGSDYNALTDGAYGSIYTGGTIVIDGAWDQAAGGATITYDLDLSGAALGYDLTSIVSYAGWSSGDLGRQGITVEVHTVGSAPLDWTSLGMGTNAEGGSSSTKVTFGDLTVSGVDSIRFTSGGTYATVFREYDAIGTATVVPEPSSTALLGLGGLALIFRRRK